MKKIILLVNLVLLVAATSLAQATVSGGDTRNATRPGIGATEFNGANLDLTPPVITYTPLPATCSDSTRFLTGVTITDITGVPVTGELMPKIYYKTGSGSWLGPLTGQLMSGNGVNGTWKFKIAVSNVPVGDSVHYFIIAQDSSAANNLISNPSAGLVATDVNTVITPPTYPNFYIVKPSLSGQHTVGANKDYPDLQTAADAYNQSCLAGPVTFLLTDASYHSATFMANPTADATHTLTIRPANWNTNVVISENWSESPVIKFVNASYVTIDGSNCGLADRSLTITNTSTLNPTAVALESYGPGQGCTHITIKNCNVGTAVSSGTGYGITLGGLTPGTAGSDNDNVLLQNNAITGADIGIYAFGTAAVSSGGMDSLVVSRNSVTINAVNPAIGIQLGNGVNCSVNEDTISVRSTAGLPVGMSLETGFVSSGVSRNIINCVNNYSGDGWGARGITVGTGLTASALTISNNFISGIGGYNSSGFISATFIGIGIGMIGINQDLTTIAGGISLCYNSVSMYGTYSNPSVCHAAALYAGSGSSGLDIRDNIFMNSMNNTNVSGSGSKNYAVYTAAANMAYNNLDYNDYAVSGAQGMLCSYLGTDVATLGAWQAATGKDAHSSNVIPVFASSADLHIVAATGTALDNLGTPINGIAIDIDNQTRSLTTPDVGADEFTAPAPPDMGATALVSPAALSCYTNAEPVTVTIKNFSATILNFSDNPVTVSVTATGGYSSNTVISSGTLASLATLDVTMPSTIGMNTPGAYTFNATTGLTGDNTPANDAMLAVTRTANPPLPASVTVSASANPANPGTDVTFTATPANGGPAPAYTWTVNGITISGATSVTYTYIPGDGDVITCVMVPNLNCPPNAPVSSNTVIMSVSGIAGVTVLRNMDIAGTQCFNAAQSITVAGNDSSFTVENGANVTMIAGQWIDYLPGTLVFEGGYMHGYITTTGQYCGTKSASMVTNTPGEGPGTLILVQPHFRVSPNPTNGTFVLDVKGMDPQENIHAEIYTMNGEKIISKNLHGGNQYELSLSQAPAGIYLLKVVSAKISGTARIIRQ